MSYWVYILRCQDNTFYTGSTNNLEQRLAAHSRGQGAKYTRGRGPFVVVYQEQCIDKSTALRREAVIKKLTRSQKINLIEKDNC